MSRASKLAAARGNAYTARQATNIAREKLQRITNERDKLRRELSDLRERLEKAEKDAKRYQWLRDTKRDESNIHIKASPEDRSFWWLTGQNADTAIDTAIAKESQS